MSKAIATYTPEPSLFPGVAHEACRAVVILPARNEEASLAATLDALHAQRDLTGTALSPLCFEVLLLLNNCTDHSADAARAWQQAHPAFPLHVAERYFVAADAHVGTARRLLMDTAWARLRCHDTEACGILSTDSDTRVAPDWIAQNLRALASGADAVGGVIELKPGELALLPEGARRSYLADREHQRLVAELEDILDPQAADPWPRHLEHFGASLACTPAVYAGAGGMPAVNPLEDMAFVDRLRRIDARLRHDPAVRVYTSSRFDGRATIGLSWQLRTWQKMHEEDTSHCVPTPEFLCHRFESLRKLRAVHAGTAGMSALPEPWRERVDAALAENLTAGEFLGRIDCNNLIETAFDGIVREGPIAATNAKLQQILLQKKATPPNV